jgi:hypothetical protein
VKAAQAVAKDLRDDSSSDDSDDEIAVSHEEEALEIIYRDVC